MVKSDFDYHDGDGDIGGDGDDHYDCDNCSYDDNGHDYNDKDGDDRDNGGVRMIG